MRFLARIENDLGQAALKAANNTKDPKERSFLIGYRDGVMGIGFWQCFAPSPPLYRSGHNEGAYIGERLKSKKRS